MAPTLIYSLFDSPLGQFQLVADDLYLYELWLPQERSRQAVTRQDNAVLERTKQQLEQYFAGSLKQFDLPIAPRGTGFQLQVWAALCDIQYGQTSTYGQLASQIGRPQAARAVGGAVNRNPLAVIIPCHRLIGAGGALTGYRGGLAVKRWLLAHEQS
ncbi:MAG: methylated-DNA--[protein]-cysteine S-methyltransferase [Bifidobacteriaceae bacterium]|jgi:methylated-DNA-[protein]-cysteine S-methyltransferase|nr:methylated-DNA--[protein]-cysteine S-methyltransferase [Bifidobacteriaceae bacterium]